MNTFRQNLQVEYVSMLSGVVKDKAQYDHVARSMALYQLNNIDKMMAANTGADVATKAHRQHIRYLVESALEQE